MTVFENIKNKNIDELVDWIDEYFVFNDDTPYLKWWETNYCNKCKPEVVYEKDLDFEHMCAYCELNNKCRFFQDMDDIPDNKQVIKMWLESEAINIKRECPECKYFVGCETACGGKVCSRFMTKSKEGAKYERKESDDLECI